jgi:hypothetical protein
MSSDPSAGSSLTPTAGSRISNLSLLIELPEIEETDKKI